MNIVAIKENNLNHILTPQDRFSTNAHILIELKNPGSYYKAGEKIEGTVKVLVDGQFDATAVSLQLYGFKKAIFTKVDGAVS